jgi:hypothetical protein
LPKLVVLVPQLGVGEDLVCDRDLLELFLGVGVVAILVGVKLDVS